MKSYYIYIVLLILASVHGQSQSWTADDVPVYKTFDDFEPILHQDTDTTYVVNFWATWCGPCVKELPYFEALHKSYKNQPVKVVLVSLDFEKHIVRKLLPFRQILMMLKAMSLYLRATTVHMPLCMKTD